MEDDPDPQDSSRREAAAFAFWRLQANCKYIDLSILEQSTVTADVGFYVELMTAFRAESARFMKTMRTQLSHNDFYAVRKTAHAMKPLGSYLGVHSLTATMGKIEKLALSANNQGMGDLMAEAEMLVDAVNADIHVLLKAWDSQ